MFSINVNPHLLWKHIAWNQFLPSRMACFIRKNSNCNQNIESLINHLVSHLRIPWPIFVIYQVKDLYIWVSTFLELYIYYFKGVSKNMLKYNKKYNIVPKISMALLYRKMKKIHNKMLKWGQSLIYPNQYTISPFLSPCGTQ